MENAKLYYKYGAMGCGKTRDLMRMWYDYNERGQETIIIKPKRDTKGDNKIVSRDNSEKEVSYLIGENDNIYEIIAKHIIYYNLDCVLVDEAQFLTEEHVMQLTDVVDSLNITVYCYGLKADFQNKLFPGSNALDIQADVRIEMPKTCGCGGYANHNVRFINGVPTFDGEQVAIDGEGVTYKSMCRRCRKRLLKNANKINS